MFICSTKKLLDHLQVQPEAITEQAIADDLFSWHAKTIWLNRRQSVVFMNDKTQYIIVLYGVRANDFSRMRSLFAQAVRIVWREEGIKEEIIEDYLAQAGEVQFCKTRSRRLIARLNNACRELEFFEEELDTSQLIQPALSLHASHMLVGVGNGDYSEPDQLLYEALQAFAGKAIFRVRAVELYVQLLLETKTVWRRLLVPLNRTFPQLHNILQTAFGWWDYHLHEFIVYDQEKTSDRLSFNHPGMMSDGTKASVNLVDNKEALAYENEIPMKLETGIKLSDYLPEAKQLVYIYDFGDDWRHWIEVTDVFETDTSNHPVCLDGVGDAPPEDVGGDGGYEMFLNAISDPEHPDHDHMKQWAKWYLRTPFDIANINYVLQRR